MDIPKIKELIALLENTEIAEIEIKEGTKSLRLSRYGKHVSTNVHIPEIPAHTTVHTQTSAPKAEATTVTPVAKGHTVRSPMVGTVYLAASPEAAAFVNVGQTIEAGSTICIIEAMKMFNEIEADKAGKVIQILVQNGQPVEFDQPLFIIE